MDRGSNNPSQVFQHIPKEIQNRLSTNLSNKDIFERRKKEYEKALTNGGYRVNLEYKD